MNKEFTLIRIRKDVLQKLKLIAGREKRTVPNQIAYFVDREEAEAHKDLMVSPGSGETNDSVES